jgi:hypothetical protein
VFAIWLFYTNEILIELELAQCAAGEEKTSSIGSGPIGKTMFDSVALEFVRVGGR